MHNGTFPRVPVGHIHRRLNSEPGAEQKENFGTSVLQRHTLLAGLCVCMGLSLRVILLISTNACCLAIVAGSAKWRAELEKERRGPKEKFYFTQTEAHEIG